MSNHNCTPETCPDGLNYFVTCVDYGRLWYMAGPYATHREALAAVDPARKIGVANDWARSLLRLGDNLEHSHGDGLDYSGGLAVTLAVTLSTEFCTFPQYKPVYTLPMIQGLLVVVSIVATAVSWFAGYAQGWTGARRSMDHR